MKAIVFVIILVALLSTKAPAADKWSARDYYLEGTWQALHVIDWGQTAMIARNPDRYYEMNPMLGRHPSTELVHAYAATGAIFHLVVTHFLPSKYRPYWQGVTIGMSAACVANNFNVGLGVRF